MYKLGTDSFYRRHFMLNKHAAAEQLRKYAAVARFIREHREMQKRALSNSIGRSFPPGTVNKPFNPNDPGDWDRVNAMMPDVGGASSEDLPAGFLSSLKWTPSTGGLIPFDHNDPSTHFRMPPRTTPRSNKVQAPTFPTTTGTVQK